MLGFYGFVQPSKCDTRQGTPLFRLAEGWCGHIVTGIPPERVIGSWTPAVGDVVDGQVSVVRGSVQVYNGHEAKPGNIETRIGRRPVFAAGNSNNDMPMCLYSVTGQHRGLAIWIHHDDSEREYDYDRSTSRMEQLVKDHGSAHEVSIKEDWNRVWKRDLKR